MRNSNKRRLACVAFLTIGYTFVIQTIIPNQVFAHGFGERYDLPVPIWLYLTGAGIVVALSFVAIGLFVNGTPGLYNYPRINLLRWSAGRAITHPILILAIKIIALAVFLLVIVAGLIGSELPRDNLAPTMIWIIWWVGLAYISAILGDVWTLINPWKTVFEWVHILYIKLGFENELSFNYPYPERLGVWPGIILFFAFAWVESVYSQAAIPLRIAQLMLAYSLITWIGMLLFGKDIWLKHGEAFSLVFGLLARFSPTEFRVKSSKVCLDCPMNCGYEDDNCVNCSQCFKKAPDSKRELNLRPFAVGLLRNESISSSMTIFVILMLSTVTYDGFTATPLWRGIQADLYKIIPDLTYINSLGLIIFPFIFIAAYLGFSSLMSITSGRLLSTIDIARAFVYSLIPIALAYHLSHFLSFLLIQGQLIIPLASDPFGYGWNLFNTSDYRINIGIVGAKFAWFTAVTAIIVAHVIAVYLAHTISLGTLKVRRAAIRSQYPMLILMVGYTVISLWIIAQPIVD